MAHTFVPFSAPAASVAPSSTARFSPLTPGSASANPSAVASSATPAQDRVEATTSNPCVSTGGNKPQVSLQRENDRITRVTIRCGCGEIIELDCEY